MADHENAKFAAVFFSALVLFSLIAGWLADRTLAATAPKLIIGYAALSARVMPLWIAEEQGIFAKYNIDSEQVFIRGAPTLVAGLASGDIHIGSTGGSASLAAVAAGHDLKMIAAFSSRNTYDLVTRSSIKKAEELRGKRFGVTSIGGTVWMGILLWLEHFALDEQRDKIQLQVIGDQSIQMQALENGTIDAAVLDGVFSRRLKQKGFNITGEYADLKQLYVSQAIVVQGKLVQQRGDMLENLLKAQVEAIAFSLAPKNKSTVIKTFMRRLRIDAATAEEGYADLHRAIDRKPYTSPEALRNVQRLMAQRNPKVAEVKIDQMIDNRIIRKLDESGFIDRAYAAQGMSLK
jgi:NitT/TauT family transport system substrate-binding protein